PAATYPRAHKSCPAQRGLPPTVDPAQSPFRPPLASPPPPHREDDARLDPIGRRTRWQGRHRRGRMSRPLQWLVEKERCLPRGRTFRSSPTLARASSNRRPRHWFHNGGGLAPASAATD